MTTSYPEQTPAQKKAWFLKKQQDRRRAQFRDMVRGSTSFNHLNGLLRTATREQAELVNARLAYLRARRARQRARQQAFRDQAERDQDARINR